MSPLIITMVCPRLINHLSDPWDFNKSNGILLRSNWRKPYPKFYGSELLLIKGDQENELQGRVLTFWGGEGWLIRCCHYYPPVCWCVLIWLAVFFFAENHVGFLEDNPIWLYVEDMYKQAQGHFTDKLQFAWRLKNHHNEWLGYSYGNISNHIGVSLIENTQPRFAHNSFMGFLRFPSSTCHSFQHISLPSLNIQGDSKRASIRNQSSHHHSSLYWKEPYVTKVSREF